MKWFFIYLINIYQFVSSLFSFKVCRFYPSCSEYAKQAFLKYNIFKAVFLIFIRVSKCHPFHPGGFDPLKFL